MDVNEVLEEKNKIYFRGLFGWLIAKRNWGIKFDGLIISESIIKVNDLILRYDRWTLLNMREITFFFIKPGFNFGRNFEKQTFQNWFDFILNNNED